MYKTMNITFITTVRHNVGDDFVREGLKYLLSKYFAGKKVKYTNIHKHSPITSRYGFEKFRDITKSSIWDSKLPLKPFFVPDRIKSADLVVQSGAPAYWCHPGNGCHQNEWYQPLIKYRWVPLHKKNSKLVNLAVGTCQRYDSDGKEFLEYPEVTQYIKEFYDLCSVTTVRDSLAKKVLNLIELDAPVIPCSSIFAKDYHNIKAEEGEYVVVNYMSGGAHYTLGQEIKFEQWKSTFKAFYDNISQKEKVVFSCHNEKEVREAKEIDPQARIFYSKDNFLDYMRFYAKAKFGIMNRVHGAFQMASYGKPFILIGNDSRARMASEIGLKSFFVNEVNLDLLMNQYELLKKGYDDFDARFRLIHKRAEDDYLKALEAI
ncbi:MAG: hypothetical protein OHK0053_23550 [Microscillaceae bacterium]